MGLIYSFTINFEPYRRDSTLSDIRSLYVKEICIFAKNCKHGGFYQSKYVSRLEGKFHYVAGSVRYPILFTKKSVKIFVENFPLYPDLEKDSEGDKYFPHITITDITKHETI